MLKGNFFTQIILKKNKDLINAIILKNLNNPLSFHTNNLKNNNIVLTTNQIRWILQKLREKEFVSDEIFLKDISKINISLDNNIPDMINIPICYKYVNLINPEKKKSTRKIYFI